MASATDYFLASSRCRMLPPAWSQAPVVMTTSHQCYGSCTGCQFISESCSRSRGSYISRSLQLLRRTRPTTVVFCPTLVFANCGLIQRTCGSCLCRERIINVTIGVSRPPDLGYGMTFHPNYAAGTFLQILQTISELISLVTEATSNSLEL